MPDDPPDSFPDAERRAGVPGELEAAEEFETAPAGATPGSDPLAPDAPPPTSPEGPAAQPLPPSAVESFEPSSDADAWSRPPAAETQSHSVPPTPPIGESTLCPRCGTENRPGVTFCRQCGQRLVAPGAATVERPSAPEGMLTCGRCGTLNRAGMPFCQNCGAKLRAPGVAPGTAGAGTYPEAAAPGTRPAPRAVHTRAVLGPLVLLIGAVGLSVAWLLPFAYGRGSLFARSFGSADGYQFAFWDYYTEVGTRLADQAYFGFAAPVPLLVALLVLLAIGGFVRGRPGALQMLGLLIAFLWALGLGALFIVVEVLGAETTQITDLLRSLTPAGIIFLLSALIVLIGLLTRFARS